MEITSKNENMNNNVIMNKRRIANRLKIKAKNYKLTQKIYGSEDISDKAKEAKEYIQNLIDPDILGLKNVKRWNVCTKSTSMKEQKIALDQILFNIRSGLIDTNQKIQLFERPNYKGIEEKYNDNYFNWNVSSTITKDEKINNIIKM